MKKYIIIFKLNFILFAGIIMMYACNTQITDGTGINNEYVYGIDISKYQGDEIDFLNKKKDSLNFIICRATEGMKGTDPDFRNNWNAIAEKKFIRGAYHFYYCFDDPIKQAHHFLSVADSILPGDLAPIIDFEEESIDKKQSPAEVQADLILCMKEIEKITGRKVILYTNLNTSTHYLYDSFFSSRALWIADYKSSVTPRMPPLWKNKKWILWQKSHTYKVDANIDDFDMFNGNINDLKNFIKMN